MHFSARYVGQLGLVPFGLTLRPAVITYLARISQLDALVILKGRMKCLTTSFILSLKEHLVAK